MDACVVPEGYVENMEDCDDLDAEIHPMATEICDTIDNDCDGLTDNDDDDLDLLLPSRVWLMMVMGSIVFC